MQHPSLRQPVLRLVSAAATVVALAGALSLAGPLPGAPATAGADPVSSCSKTAGVVVAVDFRPFGGQIQAGCDPTTTTALDALEASGFTPTGTAQYGLAFICLIDGDPTNQSCTSTPPATASWAFWTADAGTNRWTYAATGAGTLVPTAGSVEAWTFGDASPSVKPGFTPAQVRATEPTTTTTTSASTPTTRAPHGRGGGHHAGGSTNPGTVGTVAGALGASHAPTTTTTDPGTTTTSAPAGVTTTVPTSPEPQVVTAAPTHAGQASSGSPLPALLALLAVLALAGGAGLVAWRRRRAA